MKHSTVLLATALLAALMLSSYYAGRVDAHHAHVVDRSGLVVPNKVVRAMDSGWTCWVEINAKHPYDTEWLCR